MLHSASRSRRFSILLAGILVLVFALSACQSLFPRKLESLTLGVPPLEQNALMYVADAQGFFAQNELQVTLTNYDTGVTAINGLLKGDVDLAEAAEFPFVQAVFQKAPISIIASNDKFENDFVLGRKDRGIEKITDLKNKKIGVAHQTIAEFYLGRLLNLHGLNLQDVTLVDVRPAQFVNAMTSGQVDALIAWQPYIQQILAQEPNRVIAWNAHNSQAAYGILVARNEWVQQHTATVDRFLKALIAAEDYIRHHPNEANAIVRKRLNYDETYMAQVWSQHQFVLALEQSLIIAMKDEAQWMINNNLTPEKELPNLLNYVNEDRLRAVKPTTSRIIR